MTVKIDINGDIDGTATVINRFFEESGVWPNAWLVNEEKLRRLQKAAAECVPFSSGQTTCGGLALYGSGTVPAGECVAAFVGGDGKKENL